jgi:hypothetical protein
MKRQVVCILALLGAGFIMSCSHNLYPGKADSVAKLPPPEGRPAPAWVQSKDEAVGPADGYFRIAAIPDKSVTSASVACKDKRNFWSSEQANYAVTVKPQGFHYWTNDIAYPVYNKVITASDDNICEGHRDFVTILPWHPLTFDEYGNLFISYQGTSTQNLRLTNYMATAAGIAGLFSGGTVVTAFAAQESTKVAMDAVDKVYTDVTKSMNNLKEPLVITREDIQSGQFDYQLPMHYFKKNESPKSIDIFRENPQHPSVLFKINFYVYYRRSVIGVGNDGTPNEIPLASLSNALTYLTFSANPQTKSFLERIAIPYPGLIDKLKDPNPDSACGEALKFIRSAGYSPSDQAALYGALLYVASDRDRNFLFSQPKFTSTDCWPRDEFGDQVLRVYRNDLSLPIPDTTEFTKQQFAESTKELYVGILSDIAQGITFNEKKGARGYIGYKVMENVTFRSAGHFDGPHGLKNSDEAIDELSKLGVTQAGCFMPAEIVSDPAGPRLVFLSSTPDSKLIAGMVTFTLDSGKRAIAGVDIRDISPSVRAYILNNDAYGNPRFASNSKCADIIQKIKLANL